MMCALSAAPRAHKFVYDLSPGSFDLSSQAVKRRLGKDVTAYLAQMQKRIQAEFNTLERSPEFSIGVEYKLVLTKNLSVNKG